MKTLEKILITESEFQTIRRSLRKKVSSIIEDHDYFYDKIEVETELPGDLGVVNFFLSIDVERTKGMPGDYLTPPDPDKLEVSVSIYEATCITDDSGLCELEIDTDLLEKYLEQSF